MIQHHYHPTLFLTRSVLCVSALTLLASLALPTLAVSTESPTSGLIRTDRYTLTRMVPRQDQVNPLKAIINITFSSAVASIGDALEELLDGTGYRLVHMKIQYGEPIDQILMKQRLPSTLRHMGPVTLQDALQSLAGNAWMLQTNELGREVWFDVKSDYNDDQRIRRLLTAVKHSETPVASSLARASLPSEFVAFPPGKTKVTELSPAQKDALDGLAKYIQKNDDQIDQVMVKGESQSTGQHAKAALAKTRAGEVARALVQRGVPADKIAESYTFENNAARDRQGVTVQFEAEKIQQVKLATESVINTSGHVEASQATAVVNTGINDPTIVQPTNVFFLYPGEDLEIALRRWAKQALYSDLVWNVRDEAGSFVRIPIRAGATFNCEFAECLRRVKEAYATAPRPLYFDIALKESNKIVYVELLHIGD